MNKTRIALFGGSGFVGSALAHQLAREGYALRIFTRNREHTRGLWLLPDTDIVTLDVSDQESAATALQACSAAVNLIGILNERHVDDFRRAHVDTARHVVSACKRAGVPHLLHLSALQAHPSAPSAYLRSKGLAEQILHDESDRQLHSTVLRPSVIFGPQDDFLNRFATLLRLAPLLPLAGAEALLQPIYVGDVVAALAILLARPPTASHRVYEVAGPQVMRLREIVAYVAQLGRRATIILPVRGTLATLLAWSMEWVPGKPLTRDNLRSLSLPSVCAGENGLLALGLRPTPLQEIAPAYLSIGARRNRYAQYRADGVGVTRER